jgi:hypothetical protein
MAIANIQEVFAPMIEQGKALEEKRNRHRAASVGEPITRQWLVAGAVVYARTRSEARARAKQQAGIRGRLPVGTRIQEIRK